MLAIGGLVAAKFLFVDQALGPVDPIRHPAGDRRRDAGLGLADPAGRRRPAWPRSRPTSRCGSTSGCRPIGASVAAGYSGPGTGRVATTLDAPWQRQQHPTRPTRSSNRPAGRQNIATNRKARHDYAILDTYEAGISLTGTEVKSLRAGRASLVDGFATVSDDEVWLRNVHIAEYAEGTWTNHAPRRARKLLMHRLEIDRIAAKLREGGLALVPLSLYFTDGRVKVELASPGARRNTTSGRRMAKRDADREIERYAGRRAKGMTLT